MEQHIKNSNSSTRKRNSSIRSRKSAVRKTKKQYTKRAMTWILVIALFDMQLPYVLAFMGRENTLEDLSKTIVIEIIGVFLVYCVKSFFETREEKKMEVHEDETEADE